MLYYYRIEDIRSEPLMRGDRDQVRFQRIGVGGNGPSGTLAVKGGEELPEGSLGIH